MFYYFKSEMNTYLDKLKAKINEKFNPDKLLLIDNSNLHSKHKFFDSEKFHLKLIIKSEKLKKMKRIDSHRAIFETLDEEMKKKIHALEIILE